MSHFKTEYPVSVLISCSVLYPHKRSMICSTHSRKVSVFRRTTTAGPRATTRVASTAATAPGSSGSRGRRRRGPLTRSCLGDEGDYCLGDQVSLFSTHWTQLLCLFSSLSHSSLILESKISNLNPNVIYIKVLNTWHKVDVPQQTVDENTNPDIPFSIAKTFLKNFCLYQYIISFHFVCGHGQVSLEDGGDGKLDLCFLENQQSVYMRKISICLLIEVFRNIFKFKCKYGV